MALTGNKDAVGFGSRLWRVAASVVLRLCLLAVFSCVTVSLLVGCSRIKPTLSEKYVYVTAKQTYLRDRVAAVSNRTGEVQNGDKLIVLEHARRFVKVRTAKGEVGWIEDKPTVVAGQDVADKFETLGTEHTRDAAVGNATVRDEVVLHIAPGRKTESFYRLNEGDALSLLKRATVEKAVAPGAAAAPAALKPGETAPVGPPPPVMEDWWLVRTATGQTGWIYSHMIDVTEPDTLARYAEGQRIVGAYVLAYADDPESGMLDNGVVVSRISQYVTLLSPYKAGLPYDFDQVRVFTWNTKKHRYETAFRQHNIAGYLPVKIGTTADPYGKAANSAEKLPSFTFRVLAGDQALPVPDPVAGTIKPGRTIEKTYRLEGNNCRRIIAPGVAPPDEAHPEPVVEKKEKGKRKK